MEMTNMDKSILETLLYNANYIGTHRLLTLLNTYGKTELKFHELETAATEFFMLLQDHVFDNAKAEELSANINTIASIRTPDNNGIIVYNAKATSYADRLPEIKDKVRPMIIGLLIHFCTDNGIYWDDRNLDTSTLDTATDDIRKKFAIKKLFISQHMVSRANVTTNKSHNTSARTTTTASGNKYSNCGPQSSNIPANIMLGTPGQPEKLSGSILYWITSDKKGKNQPQAFVAPVNEPNANPPIKCELVNGALKLKFGSGNNYGNSRCYWSTRADAQQVANRIASAVQAAGFNNIQVVGRQCTATEGYYKVQTEVGPVYIEKTKLNEELDEDFDDQQDIKTDELTKRAENAAKLAYARSVCEGFNEFYN